MTETQIRALTEILVLLQDKVNVLTVRVDNLTEQVKDLKGKKNG